MKQETSLAFAQKKLLRIIWPVCIAILSTLLVCLTCMDFNDLNIAGKNAVCSAVACNNIQLSESGAEYFSDDSTWNPLLHTWYIAITVQVYILFYAGYRLMFSWKKCLRYGVLVLVALFSFFYGTWDEGRLVLIQFLHLPVWMSNESTMYYSTVARLWEPLAGAAVFLLPVSDKKWLNSLLSAAAVITISVCVWWQQEYCMLYVVLAAMVLIRYGGDHLITYVYSNKLIRGIGGISFSIYLVHMPFIVCHKCSTFSQLDYTTIACLLASILLISCSFWYLVEKRKVSLLSLLAVWVSTLIAGAVIWGTDGLKNHWNSESNHFVVPSYPELKEETDETLYAGFDKEKIGHYQGWIIQTKVKLPRDKRIRWINRLGAKDKNPSFVLMGDSHAGHYVTGLDVLCKEHHVAGINLTTIIIPFWNRTQQETIKNYYFNQEKAEALMHWLKQHPELTHVIIGQTWDRPDNLKTDWNNEPVPAPQGQNNLPALREFCMQLKNIGKRVIIMGAEPRFEEKTPMRYFRYLRRNGLTAADKPYSKCTSKESAFNHTFAAVIDYMKSMEQDGICKVLYPHQYLYEKGNLHIEKQGIILYKDNHHLSIPGSEYLMRAMWKDISRVLGYSDR